VPHKFEAGTPPIAEIVGLGAAVDYLSSPRDGRIREHEVALTAYALRTLHERFGDRLTVHGPSEPAMRGGVFSLALAERAPPRHLAGARPARRVRAAGHHCAKPLMRSSGVGATARASVYLYNDEADIDALGRCARRGRIVLRPLTTPEHRSTCTLTGVHMAGLEDLYREIILDHYRSPRNRGDLPTPAAVRAEGSTRCAATRSSCTSSSVTARATSA
jgi:hypothetical protein